MSRRRSSSIEMRGPPAAHATVQGLAPAGSGTGAMTAVEFAYQTTLMAMRQQGTFSTGSRARTAEVPVPERSHAQTRVSLTSASHAAKGLRPTMEDCHSEACFCQIPSTGSVCAFYGVYDGHAGHDAAQFVATHLQTALVSEIGALHPFVGQNQVDSLVQAALHRAFLKVDEALRTNDCHGGGCTAVTALVLETSTRGGIGSKFIASDFIGTAVDMQHKKRAERGLRLYCANVGDSRCILCRGRKALPLSIDHKPERTDEKNRITAAGGIIESNRVMGVLAVTRAFGDTEFKTPLALVLAEPEVLVTSLVPTDQFLVLACDGLFDVMTDQEVVDFVLERLQQTPVHPDNQRQMLKRIAEDLVDAALRNGSSDNVTCVIVQLNHQSRADGHDALEKCMGKPLGTKLDYNSCNEEELRRRLEIMQVEHSHVRTAQELASLMADAAQA